MIAGHCRYYRSAMSGPGGRTNTSCEAGVEYASLAPVGERGWVRMLPCTYAGPSRHDEKKRSLPQLPGGKPCALISPLTDADEDAFVVELYAMVEAKDPRVTVTTCEEIPGGDGDGPW